MLAPCAIGGMALLSAGLCRSRNASDALVGAVCGDGRTIPAYVAVSGGLALVKRASGGDRT